MIKSKYETRGTSWSDRIATMRADLMESDGARLYFIVALSLLDSSDNNDYDRHALLERISAILRKSKCIITDFVYAEVSVILERMENL